MTDFEIEDIPFHNESLSEWAKTNKRHTNWPVVYTILNEHSVYVGETLNAAGRLRQHLESSNKKHLREVRVILDESFNKSACLDLESTLIRLFAGDGKFQVLNRNEGITEAEYFDRLAYQQRFNKVFEELRSQGLFSRSIPEIENSDLFKLSPFKALTQDQASAVEEILESFFDDLKTGATSTSVVQGNPGTGKTVVAIFLLKLLSDIGNHEFDEVVDEDSFFAPLFTPENVKLAKDLRVAFVVPQQSLRLSLQKVFAKTPGLQRDWILTPFEVGKATQKFDLIVVDEAHRLGQRSNQSAGSLNSLYTKINEKLFGNDDKHWTQLDWIKKVSKHQILMLDSGQAVRPGDLPLNTTLEIAERAKESHRLHPLVSQMRVRAGEDYVRYVRDVLEVRNPQRQHFQDYDLRLFEDIHEMYEQLMARNEEVGLGRLVAGYAWEWKSKSNKSAFDIQIDGLNLRWNSTDKDWVNSGDPTQEVGSIHVIQGYDLNYAGVIIGQDLKFNQSLQQTIMERDNYFDKKGKENNAQLGIQYTDEDLAVFIRNIYGVLLTRGILGTYVYVCDPALREYLKEYF